MTTITPGDQIALEYGGHAKVLTLLGSGGQGTVYKVEYAGKIYALKWYFADKLKNPEKFRKNLEQNINDGPPSDKFLWPKYLTKESEYESFGYLMDLRPSGYEEFVDILNTYKIESRGSSAVRIPVKFVSLEAMVNAALNIVNAFRQLHRAGKSYQDLNDGGFFINTFTGDVLVCDCDNIAPEGENFGIGGKPGYMAPEVVRGIARPDVQTDKYSLAVVLFKLLFRGDPLEGKKVVESVCLTEQADLRHYGKDPVFVYDPANDRNRPVRGIHDNVIKLWRIYPSYIKDAFIKSFTEGIQEPRRRMIENEWQKLFARLRSSIIPCYCGRTSYAVAFKKDDQKNYLCPKCGTLHYNLKTLQMDIPLYKGKKLYQHEVVKSGDDYTDVRGEIIENKIKKGVLGIKNLSRDTWRVKMPNGEERDLAPGAGAPLWNGFLIDFGSGYIGQI